MVVFVSVRFRVILLKPFKDVAAGGLQFFLSLFSDLTHYNIAYCHLQGLKYYNGCHHKTYHKYNKI